MTREAQMAGRTMRAVACWAVLLALVGAIDASAEEAGLLGARVRVAVAGSSRIVGVMTGSDAEALAVRTSEQGPVTRVARDSVVRLEVSRGVRRNTKRGLVGGALAWMAVVGLVAAFDTLDESGVGEPLFVGGMVAAGGVVGSLIKTERWERVPMPAVSARVMLRRRGVAVELALRF
jgi:hypothetical protein